MNRLPAFTLFEVLISLLLVVILGTIALLTLEGSVRNMSDMGGISARQLAMLWFCQQAQADMDAAVTLTAAPGGALEMACGTGVVRYEQQGDSLVRITADARTAQVLCRSIALRDLPDAPGLVKEWSVQLGGDAGEGTGPLVFCKEYDRQAVLRYLIDHGDPGTDAP